MTSLPSLPTNFSATPVKTPEEIQKAQEELDKATKKVEELLAKYESYSDQLEELNKKLSIGGQVKEQIIKGTVDPLLDVGCINLELPLLQLSLLVNLYLLSLQFPTIPVIPDAIKLALGIQIDIPIELPTVAEFKQYVNQKIEEGKQKCQQEAIKKQLQDAQQEETPFTARQNASNKTAKKQEPDSSCITTETGKTLAEALRKAEFKLKRVQKCCECCGDRELKILSNKQENGVFIVTAGILES